MVQQLTQHLEGHSGEQTNTRLLREEGRARELLTPAEEEQGFISGQDGFLGGRGEWRGFYHGDASSPGGWRGPTGQMTSEVLTGTFQGGG